LVVLVSAGQANDAPAFEHLLAPLRVDRPGGRRARTRPERVLAHKAYSSRAIRRELRRRGITAVIPLPSDQIAHRKRRGSRGGRPSAFDAADYKGRNVIERGFNVVKQWRGLANFRRAEISLRSAAHHQLWLTELQDFDASASMIQLAMDRAHRRSRARELTAKAASGPPRGRQPRRTRHARSAVALDVAHPEGRGGGADHLGRNDHPCFTSHRILVG
jgi:putative transposase